MALLLIRPSQLSLLGSATRPNLAPLKLPSDQISSRSLPTCAGPAKPLRRRRASHSSTSLVLSCAAATHDSVSRLTASAM